MAKQKLGGYLIEIGDEKFEYHSVELNIYINGMMAFAYDEIELSKEDEIDLLQETVDDLSELIEQKKQAL